jgi:hypothetical protein
MKYLSFAEWPEGTCRNRFGKPISQDTHESKESAERVCRLLEREGYGGQGEAFPIRTWTEPETMEIEREKDRQRVRINKAADLAAKHLREGGQGLAIYNAVRETGVSKKDIEAELNRRRIEAKKRREAKNKKDQKS